MAKGYWTKVYQQGRVRVVGRIGSPRITVIIRETAR